MSTTDQNISLHHFFDIEWDCAIAYLCKRQILICLVWAHRSCCCKYEFSCLENLLHLIQTDNVSIWKEDMTRFSQTSICADVPDREHSPWTVLVHLWHRLESPLSLGPSQTGESTKLQYVSIERSFTTLSSLIINHTNNALTFGASLRMIRFSKSGGWEGRTPSKIFLKYEAYRRCDGIVNSSGLICLHLAIYASASFIFPNPASPIQHKKAASTVDVLPFPVRQWITATFLQREWI